MEQHENTEIFFLFLGCDCYDFAWSIIIASKSLNDFVIRLEYNENSCGVERHIQITDKICTRYYLYNTESGIKHDKRSFNKIHYNVPTHQIVI